jgi:2,3-dihydroxyphenylpropionate 1,2-dioxygenase
VLGDVVRAAPGRQRVLVIASGGLSHWLPSNDPREIDGDRRTSVIHGRADVRAVAAVREPRVRAMGGNPDARVADAWDTWFLDRLTSGDVDGVAAIGDAQLERDAGTGGHEVRTWLVGQAAADRPLVWTAYEPVPEWITGMGAGATFAVD